MKVVLDIKDSKAEFFMELLKNFSYVKTHTLTSENRTKIAGASKQRFIKEFEQALREIKLIEQGKLKARPIKELLDEL